MGKKELLIFCLRTMRDTSMLSKYISSEHDCERNAARQQVDTNMFQKRGDVLDSMSHSWRIGSRQRGTGAT